MVQRLIPHSPIKWWQGTLVAIASTFAAWLIRAALHNALGDQAPYSSFFIAAFITTLVAGWRNGLVSAFFGGLAGYRTFVGPLTAHLVFDARSIWGLLFYFLLALAFVRLGYNMTALCRRQMDLSERLSTVNDEYRHRIKNVLAITQALVLQTGGATISVPEFREKLLERLRALAQAQDIISDNGADKVPLGKLLEQTLSPFGLNDRLVHPLPGADVLIPSADAVSPWCSTSLRQIP